MENIYEWSECPICGNRYFDADCETGGMKVCYREECQKIYNDPILWRQFWEDYCVYFEKKGLK